MNLGLTAVYRLYDAADRLLYVGVGERPGSRWDDHATKPWWADVHHATVVWRATRADALTEERDAIRNENPAHNITGTGKEFKTLGPPFAPGATMAAAFEIGQRLNVNRQRVQQLVSEPDFPAPHATITAGRIWLVEDIERWIEEVRRTAGQR